LELAFAWGETSGRKGGKGRAEEKRRNRFREVKQKSYAISNRAVRNGSLKKKKEEEVKERGTEGTNLVNSMTGALRD